MSARRDRRATQLFRLASLVLPPALAFELAFGAQHQGRLHGAVAMTLGPLWLLTALGLAARSIEALVDRSRARPEEGKASASLLDRLALLTSAGTSLAWLSSFSIALSVWVGWASLSVVGLFGLGLLHLVVLYRLAVAGGADPFRKASVTRSFMPATATEGEPVLEQLRLSRPRIPTGFRLFAEGRVGPRWTTSRYVVDDGASSGEIVLESEVGPARRGEHRAEPLLFWLQDVFGLTRSPYVRAGEAELTVLPRACPVRGDKALLSAGGADKEPRPALRMPTEGSLQIREYQPGDDARRVHWVRSLATGKLMVRLPDEVPPDLPSVRIVLDTFLPGTETFSCAAPATLLDALVEVWLSVAESLAQRGAKVTMVLPVTQRGPQGDSLAARSLRLGPATRAEARKLGALASWQASLPVESMLGKEPTYLVSCRVQPLLAGGAFAEKARWIVVPEPAWTCFDEPLPSRSVARLPLPLGVPDNRWARRKRATWAWWRGLGAHTAFTRHASGMTAPRGSFSARPMRQSPTAPRQIALEVMR
ncbi:MAG: DUF58 domain-containing protein [Byssovorax sp.]